MLIDPHDGRCRACSGQLEIVEADGDDLRVHCLACGQADLVDPADYGETALSYYYGFAAGRETPVAETSQHAETPNRRRDIEQLGREIADLRQIVAALTLIALEGYSSPDVDIDDLVCTWACQEFDADILQELCGEPEDSAAEPEKKPPSESQRELFSAEESDSTENV